MCAAKENPIKRSYQGLILRRLLGGYPTMPEKENLTEAPPASRHSICSTVLIVVRQSKLAMCFLF